ncbi:MAG: FprA family A-type flavoprotein [Deltaproteobacteria bacterium]|nr:FprA family A-type flavoprotein [Deltaproteobacteria bacterium]
MAKVLVAFATRTGQTKRIAEAIGDAIRAEGHDVTIENINKLKKEADLEGYDGYVFGAATYHGEMMGPMKTFLFMAEKANLEGKAGGAFGAYGWSGEGSIRVFDTMKNVFNMDMVGGPLRIKKIAGDGAQKAQAYAKEIAAKLG